MIYEPKRPLVRPTSRTASAEEKPRDPGEDVSEDGEEERREERRKEIEDMFAEEDRRSLERAIGIQARTESRSDSTGVSMVSLRAQQD